MDVFVELTLIIILATIVSFFARSLKQPLIVGYILTGILAGPYFLNLIASNEIVELFSRIGITILLFIVGLNLNPSVAKEVGKVSLITGISQVTFTSFIGYLICLALGFNHLSSLYIAIALTFSSTIIILKLLSDKGDTDRLYGRITIGLLIIQDVIATVILMIISSFAQGPITDIFFLNLLKGIFLLFSTLLIGKYIIPTLTHFAAKSQELLFLFSLSWGLGLAVLFHYLGFSVEIGALIAGVSLASTFYASEISSRLKPLRDFFVVIFFILLGSQMALDVTHLLIPSLILSTFVLIGNPLIVMILLNLLGYNQRIAFNVGLTVAQISEFSLILATLGYSSGHITRDILSLITFVGLFTIAGSSYLIMYSNKIYPRLKKLLSFLEFRPSYQKESNTNLSHDLILFGYDRVGDYFVHAFSQLKLSFIVIDFNPTSIDSLNKQNIPNLYGDAQDSDLLKDLHIDKTKLIISTIPDFETNTFLLRFIRHLSSKIVVIVTAKTHEEAIKYYQLDASYVLMPHHLGAHAASKMIRKIGLDHAGYRKEKQEHLSHLTSNSLI